jgi:RNA polymerase sigma-70 factor (ECF subfamily)
MAQCVLAMGRHMVTFLSQSLIELGTSEPADDLDARERVPSHERAHELEERRVDGVDLAQHRIGEHRVESGLLGLVLVEREAQGRVGIDQGTQERHSLGHEGAFAVDLADGLPEHGWRIRRERPHNEARSDDSEQSENDPLPQLAVDIHVTSHLRWGVLPRESSMAKLDGQRGLGGAWSLQMSHRLEALSDIELLSLLSGGDLDAAANLYDRYASMLFALSLRIVRERAEAEDVLHDAFITMNDRASQYTAERGSVVAWLVTLVRNLSIDRTRRRDRRGTILKRVATDDPKPAARDPETLLSDATAHARVRRALAKLPEVQRLTLEVAFFEGLSYPEIAEREGVPLGTIKSRAARALGSLREALEEERVYFDELGPLPLKTSKPGKTD